MVRETLELTSSSDRTPGGYCWTGRIIKIAFGAASQDFYDHRINCPPCDQALTREQNAMRRDAAADRRKKGEL